MRTRIALVTALAVVLSMFTTNAAFTGAAASTAPGRPDRPAPPPVSNELVSFVSTIGRAPAPAPPAAAPPAATPTGAAPPPPRSDASSTDTADWACIRVHESGDRYHSAAAPSGAYGIVPITWHSYGYAGWPYEASAGTQDALALALYHRYGWSPWTSRYACGL